MKPEISAPTTAADGIVNGSTDDRHPTIPRVVPLPVRPSDCLLCERCQRDVPTGRARRCAKRVGIACFLFFLVKGLLWLLVPLLWALSARR